MITAEALLAPGVRNALVVPVLRFAEHSEAAEGFLLFFSCFFSSCAGLPLCRAL